MDNEHAEHTGNELNQISGWGQDSWGGGGGGGCGGKQEVNTNKNKFFDVEKGELWRYSGDKRGRASSTLRNYVQNARPTQQMIS